MGGSTIELTNNNNRHSVPEAGKEQVEVEVDLSAEAGRKGKGKEEKGKKKVKLVEMKLN